MANGLNVVEFHGFAARATYYYPNPVMVDQHKHEPSTVTSNNGQKHNGIHQFSTKQREKNQFYVNHREGINLST